MSEQREGRAERMTRYKEQRRKQLASQFGPHSELQLSSKPRISRESPLSSSDSPRETKTSRLRAAATALDNSISSKSNEINTASSGSEIALGNSRVERDKSSRRKSNLNRSLNSEEVPSVETKDDSINRRRRRRFFPPEVLQQSLSKNHPNDKLVDDNNTATDLSTTQVITGSTNVSKKSELRVHMENARRGIVPSCSELGLRYKAPSKRILSTPKAKTRLSSTNAIVSDLSLDNKKAERDNKENVKQTNKDKVKSDKLAANVDGQLLKSRRSSTVSKRMDELTALTKETLARVERLANRNRPSPPQDIDIQQKKTSNSKVNTEKSYQSKNLTSETKHISNVISGANKDKAQFAMLKRSSKDESSDVLMTTVNATSVPTSILKRKVSQDECRLQLGTVSPTFVPPPVTFSPNISDKKTNTKRQGILKKRRSLDENQVLRHRSYSPDVSFTDKTESRSILKNQRRSSLEDIVRAQSLEFNLHGILKRKSSKTDDYFEGNNSPHSILKRKSDASSASSTCSTSHVSITTAVILAAAGGAEMILESGDVVKPILKKKSISDDHSCSDNKYNEPPKPILKKKSSTDTDEAEERRKRPILKHSKNSVEEKDGIDTSDLYHPVFHKHNSNITINANYVENDVKPILKQSSKEDSSRSRLLFNDVNISSMLITTEFPDISNDSVDVQRSHSICTEFEPSEITIRTFEDRELQKPRPLSVSQLVMNFEQSTGAVPKTSSSKRRNERYRTQPVTHSELRASLNSVRGSPFDAHSPFDNHSPSRVLITSPLPSDKINSDCKSSDLTVSSENDSGLNILCSDNPNISIDREVNCKMSSDSAFQSLGDGLELDLEDKPPKKPFKDKRFGSMEMNMKLLAEEAQKMRSSRASGSGEIFKIRNRKSEIYGGGVSNRFSTQPVTHEEVQEAANLKNSTREDSDEPDPSKLSLSERIKMFNKKMSEENSQSHETSKRRFTRFQTQPVTTEEVESARNIVPADNGSNNTDVHFNYEDPPPLEKKSILKSSSFKSSPRKSMLKKSNFSIDSQISPRPILKLDMTDFSRDEGISSDSEPENQYNKKVSVSSNSEDDSASNFKKRYAQTIYEMSMNIQKRTRNNDSVPLSSDDSSGGREITRIISGHDTANTLTTNIQVSKSKSQTAIGDEIGSKAFEVRRSTTHAAMPKSIAELQAKLKKSGDSEWRKRIPKLNSANEELSALNVKNLYNDELSEKSSILATKKDELDAAAKQWKNRIEQADAVNFSVAGRMNQNEDVATVQLNLPTSDKIKHTPHAKRFKGRGAGDTSKMVASTPSSPEKTATSPFTRSISLSESNTNLSPEIKSIRKVAVVRPDDFTFKSFFKSTEHKKKSDHLHISVEDLDSVPRQCTNLLVQKRTVRFQRRREGSRNPVKTLAARTDLKDEYTEILTGVAERETRRINIEKLAKTSNLAMEALAGLASKEDFSSVELKKSSVLQLYLPYKDLMLLQVKGRRHVQTRLVEPTAASINQGDCFVLITPDDLYTYIGSYSNVIEQSRAMDVANHIYQTKDMGCKIVKIIVINPNKNQSSSKEVENFWLSLGVSGVNEVVGAGHPDEDEIFENTITETNMIYELQNDELVPHENYWGSIPKFEMLDATKILVFDFGTEMYVWSGINAPSEEKRLALKLAKELWNEGYNYSDCIICPINVALKLGSRKHQEHVLKSSSRPSWSLFAKLTQHRETILFREKFLNWPDYSKIIRVKETDKDKLVEVVFDVQLCKVEDMVERDYSEPDLIIDNSHLGRGTNFFDEETKRMFTFKKLEITCWSVLEYETEKLVGASFGQFHSGNSYIIRWKYQATITGRELGGNPSKHHQAGRDQCVYFCWQGSEAPINDKGAAALLTVELDSENARQIRVSEGLEPAAFLQLFEGRMVIHKGRREKSNQDATYKLYISRGEIETETVLIEVPCSMRYLRSKASFLLIDCKKTNFYIWHGAKSSSQTRKVTQDAVEHIVQHTPSEFMLSETDEITIEELEEGEESKEFLEALDGDKRQLYLSLLKSTVNYKSTARLFHLTNLCNMLKANEVQCPHKSNYTTPYPFLQYELYSVNQPALFLLDVGCEVWLWQGWWPEREDDMELTDQTGSGAVRWQAERRAAMQIALKYCQLLDENKHTPAYLTWAGLEPLAFTNLFPFWVDRDDIAELNIKEGKKAGEKVLIEKELALLTKSSYSLSELLQHPLPDGVDPTHLENYLSSDDFIELMSMDISEFQKLPIWKQTALKKEKGLF